MLTQATAAAVAPTLAPRRTHARVQVRHRLRATEYYDDSPPCLLVCSSKECKRKGALKTYEMLSQSDQASCGMIKVSGVRCFSECADGPNVKVNPEGVVLNGIKTAEDVEAVIQRALDFQD